MTSAAIVPAEQVEIVRGSGFDYNLLDESVAKFVWQRAQQVRWRNGTIAECMIQNGRDLIAVKDRLPKGHWTQWLKDEFNWSVSVALDMIRIARVFGDIDGTNAETSGKALRLLASPQVPEAVQQRACELLESGQAVTMADAVALIRETNPGLSERSADNFYWYKRRRQEAQQIISHAAEFQAAVRNLQIAIAEVHGVPPHPRIGKALDQLTDLIAVIMQIEEQTPISRQGIRNSKSSSRYVGVHWHKENKKWVAQIRPKDRKICHLGYFDTEEEAARAYDRKARELYGDKARLNFPDETRQDIT